MIFYYERDRSGQYESYVLEDNGQILGILCIQKQRDSLYLSRLGVKKGCTGKGFGINLTLFALQKAKEYNKKKLTCKVHKNAWAFYENMGFKKLGEYDDSHWGKSALMELAFTY